MRAPPHFREELHPEEIVRRPSRHPWLGTIALVGAVAAAGVLLRLLDVADGTGAAAARATQPLPGHAVASTPGGAGLAGAAAGRRP